MKTIEKNRMIRTETREILDFYVEYTLTETEREGRPSYNIHLLKKCENGNTETASGIDFHWNKEKAIEIFEKIVVGLVTPISLEDVLGELL